MRILLMLTSGLPGHPNHAIGLDQVVAPYHLLHNAGADLVVASSLGGDPPIRGARKRSARSFQAVRRLQDDHRARDAIADTLKFGQVYPEDFDGGLCLGALEGHSENDDALFAVRLITALLVAGKPMAVVPSNIYAAQAPLDGLLITGDQARSPLVAAKALLAALDPSD